jgi:hypothetical protein
LTLGFILGLILRLEVTSFAAIPAIKLAVFGEPQFVIRMAKRAVTTAGALGFHLVTNPTLEFFMEHKMCLLPPLAVLYEPIAARGLSPNGAEMGRAGPERFVPD